MHLQGMKKEHKKMAEYSLLKVIDVHGGKVSMTHVQPTHVSTKAKG